MQRQPRLGDILDDYCPRERRLTNHAVVAMIGDVVKQTRCATCDTEHEYKHAKVPRQRRKDSPAALQAQILAGGPKKVTPDAPSGSDRPAASEGVVPPATVATDPAPLSVDAVRRALSIPGVPGARSSGRASEPSDAPRAVAPPRPPEEAGGPADEDVADRVAAAPGHESEGPAHRRLIRATLPRLEGQPPTARPAPEFTIRTPSTGRPPRFRPRNQRGAGQLSSNTRQGQGGNVARGGPSRGGNNRAPQSSRPARRFDGRKRSK